MAANRSSDSPDPSSTGERDTELLRRLRSDDAAALDELLQAYWTPLVTYAAGLTARVAAAEDVVQEAYVRLWSRRRTWRPGSARALLYRMVRNLALNERRRARTHERLAPPARRAGPSPSEVMEGREVAGAVREAIDALPSRRREVFLLSREQGLSHREIAEALNLSPQTVANQISAALGDLRAALAPYLGPEDP
ncbi:MAG: sigma-70 family RNA polymerase sigma factor [Gemmatimonadota bacterium]